MYYSNEDLENFYVRYKAGGLPKKSLIQAYCLRNKVSWTLFNKWYCDTRHRIEEVTVTGRPEGGSAPGSVRPLTEGFCGALPQLLLQVQSESRWTVEYAL